MNPADFRFLVDCFCRRSLEIQHYFVMVINTSLWWLVQVVRGIICFFGVIVYPIIKCFLPKWYQNTKNSLKVKTLDFLSWRKFEGVLHIVKQTENVMMDLHPLLGNWLNFVLGVFIYIQLMFSLQIVGRRKNDYKLFPIYDEIKRTK